MHEHIYHGHKFKYCERCDVVYCESCKKEWGGMYQGTTYQWIYPYYTPHTLPYCGDDLRFPTDTITAGPTGTCSH